MAPITYNYQITFSIPPARFFKAAILDDDLLPKIFPQAIKSVEIREGDGGAGTVKLVTFAEGSQRKTAKHIVDAIDKEKWTYSFTVHEADEMKDVLEKTSNAIKVEASADGGSICKITSTYYAKGDAQISEEQIKAEKDKAVGMLKAVEAYLLANPNAYN